MKKNLEENIKIAMDKHPSYQFNSNSFDSKDRKIDIECPKHGLFRQRLYYSMIGCLCPKCAIEKRVKERRYTLDEFVNESIKTHGKRYDYSRVKYINNNTKVCIICPEHGEFWQTPTSHINNKSGCPYCAGTKKRSSDEFVKKAREIHGGKYDYSKVNYINQTTKVSIICPEHGEFLQIPNSHLNGRGCPLCKTSHIEREINQLFNDELNINFVYQYHNKELFGQQSLDFFYTKFKISNRVSRRTTCHCKFFQK